MLDRRGFLRAAAGAAAALPLACRGEAPRWRPEAVRKPTRSPVAILPAPDYSQPALVDAVRRGLALCGVDPRGLGIVLKPNLVEHDPSGVINTHPALVAAAIEAFRSEGARDVVVAEGPGHRRDNEHLLRASGLADQLRDMGARYVDLNHDAVRRTRLRSSFTRLGELWLPATVLDADLFVSMPKLKTHHWAGATLSMKNLFGIVPGAVYGWPKNPLHWAGLEGSIVDVNAALEGRRFNIVDGVVGMEGNGPIQGEARPVGALVFGEDPVAVDASAARLMSLDPARLPYLAASSLFLGNLEEERIEVRGEDPDRFRADFRVVEDFEHAKVSSS
ncbi:MAG: DUF362 domain-containing protein [Gemmatimonadota bacterium]|nr:DUF362 domain-containing protein [Gemmatimonadota bacterium]